MEFIAKHTNDPFVLIGDQSVSVRSWIARELVSNLLAHREYSKAFNAKLIIERERIYTENWNRSNEYGRIDPENFTPQSKNPIIAKFFMNIGRADQLGSGIRNLYKYTKLYSGGEPELIEGDIFKTVIPLPVASEKQADNEQIQADNDQNQADNDQNQADNEQNQADNDQIQADNDQIQADNDQIQADSKRIPVRRTSEKKLRVMRHLQAHGQGTVADFAGIFNVSVGRARAILLEMTKEGTVKKVGKTKSAYYVLR
jgi:predicted HTH transcriptional regulator